MRKASYVIRCTDEQRRDYPARYKIAAEWSGGGYTELKTFGFADDECLERVFRAAQQRVEKFKPDEGEKLGPLRIYVLNSDRHDYELERVLELEQTLLASAGAAKPATPR